PFWVPFRTLCENSVHCQVVLTKTEQSVQGSPGGLLKLTCDSTNFFLHMSQLKPEDSAVYYCRVVFVLLGICPCHTVYGYFDYWGKGTMVTGLNQHVPIYFLSGHSVSVSLLSAPIGNTQYLMCMIEDLAVVEVTVTWKKNDKEVEGPTPTVGLQPSGLYSASSLLKVNNTDWNNKVKYSCVVQHQGQNPTIKTISKTGLYIGEDCTTVDVMLTYRISII
uniref:Ig-like domain-containing protein n=1 Tax=Oncorhynchus kisutch TaxID=8019 RepID=A0A8C7JF51_ONCKI